MKWNRSIRPNISNKIAMNPMEKIGKIIIWEVRETDSIYQEGFYKRLLRLTAFNQYWRILWIYIVQNYDIFIYSLNINEVFFITPKDGVLFHLSFRHTSYIRHTMNRRLNFTKSE